MIGTSPTLKTCPLAAVQHFDEIGVAVGPDRCRIHGLEHLASVAAEAGGAVTRAQAQYEVGERVGSPA